MSNAGDVWQDDGDGKAKPPRRKSSNVRTIIIILAVCGCCCVLCCGGFGLFFWSLMPITSPEGVRKATETIVDIEIPNRFQPQFAWNFLGQLRFSIYQVGNTPDEGMLVLGSFSKQMQSNGQNPRKQMQDALRSQGHEDTELKVEKTESREFTIRGEKCKFEFVEGKDPDTDEEFRQVTGTFPAKSGEGILVLRLPAEDFDEAEIVKMIESIH
jgi:hypothetical protein